MVKLSKSLIRKEFYFQLFLHIIVFVFYSVDENQPKITLSNVVFFLNYTLAGLLINYIFLQRYFYRKKYLVFSILLLLTVFLVMFLEEGVLEKIFYPDTRGKGFPGLMYTLLQILPVIIILTGGKFAWDALVKQRQVDRLEAAVKESELLFLKSQINPHFLFNNLNNLYSYALENSPKTPDLILQLSSVLRYMLYECREKFVPLKKEIEQLQNFVRLSQLQIEDRGKIDFNSSPIDEQYVIAPLILVVFIENAFKHSMASQANQISIDMDIKVSENGRLTFRCENSYQDIANNENISHGIGLKNVRKRLELIYEDAHQLTIKDQDGKFLVELSMDLTIA